MEKKRKVILIDGKSSNWYDQAIFIVSKDENQLPKNLVSEAEKIINEYINQKYTPNMYKIYEQNSPTVSHQTKAKKQTVSSNRKNKNIKSLLNFSIFCTAIVICCLIYTLII